MKQRVHRELAARVGETYHDAIDLSVLDDRWNLSNGPDDAGIDE